MSERQNTIFPSMPDVSKSTPLTSLNRKTGLQADNNLIVFEKEHDEFLLNDLVFYSTEWPKKEVGDRSLDSRSVTGAQSEQMSVEISQQNNRHLQLPKNLRVKESDWGYANTQIDGYDRDLGERAVKIVSNYPVIARSVESRWTEPQIQRAGFSDKSVLPGEIVLVHESRDARECAGKAGTGRHKIKTVGEATGGQDCNNSQNVTMEERSGDSFEQRRVRPRMVEEKPGVGRSAVAVVQRPVGVSKDRHSKVNTAKGLRDRRVRLSATTAIQFFDVQDRLGYDQPSKAVDWLIKKARAAIDELAPAEVGGGVAAAGETGAEEWAAGRGGSDEGGGGLAEERLEESGGKVWQEEMGGGGGGRAESRAKARERARERAKERFNATVKAPPPALDSPPPPLEAAHNLHLLPELFLLSQPILFSDHSSALLRPSAAQIPPPPIPSCNPLSPPDFSLQPPPPASFLTIPSASASPQLLHFPSHFLHLSAPSPCPSTPPPYLFQDLPSPYDRPRPSSLHLSSSSSAAASLPGPGPPPLPASSVISTRGTLQSIFNPVASLSQVQSLLIGHDAAQGCESDFHATSPTSRTSMMSALHNPSASRVIHGMENAEEETRTSSSMYLQ